MNEYRALIADAEQEYGRRWRYSWKLQGVNVERQPDGYYLRRDVQTVAYFADKPIAARFLVDYIATGKPNFAMLRKDVQR